MRALRLCGAVAGVLASLMVSACSSGTVSETMAEPSTTEASMAATSETDLIGRAWQLTQIASTSEPSAGVDEWPLGPPTIRFLADGTVCLFNGCNGMRGSFSLAADTVEFSDVWASRLRGCDDVPTSSTVDRVIGSDPTWALTGQMLVLTSAADPGTPLRLLFEMAP
jgi:heat shock protein HslJ